MLRQAAHIAGSRRTVCLVYDDIGAAVNVIEVACSGCIYDPANPGSVRYVRADAWDLSRTGGTSVAPIEHGVPLLSAGDVEDTFPRHLPFGG